MEMSITESFNHSLHTPFYKNEQNERENIQWRLPIFFGSFCLVRITAPMKKIPTYISTHDILETNFLHN